MAPKKEKKEISVERRSRGGSTATNATSNADNGEPQKWAQNERILCIFPPNSAYKYEAKIIAVDTSSDETVYMVHYQGWNSRHDEKITETQALERFTKYTEPAAQEAKSILTKVRASQDTKKRKSVLDKADDSSSRGSTPLSTADKKPRRGPSTSNDPIPDALCGGRDAKRLELPDALRKILLDDHHNINTMNMLPRIPARVTVAEIINSYIVSLHNNDSKGDLYMEYGESQESLVNASTETCEQMALGLKDYFDVVLANLLLYKFERLFYKDFYEKELDKLPESNSATCSTTDEGETVNEKFKIRMSNYYGLIHLLRMLSRFGEMIAHTNWNSRAVETLMSLAQDFVIFLNKNHKDFYDLQEDYVVATPDYQKQLFIGTT